ncbi:NEL-type E3 ubiquitin ligase domain-containing protein [Pseudomonas sp. UM16]|uniref:NEL-type E3 ubiquitin ligase domain-containing protein n=1 Tax=Pseudomonas sp. UM16 TaxID=3158962 RepID=UPI0039900BD0
MNNLPPEPDSASIANHEIIPHAQRVISSKVPSWLAQATPDVLKKLRTHSQTPTPWFEAACLADPHTARMLVAEYGLHRTCEAEVQALLKPLPELQQFASEHLTKELKDRFDLDLDVTQTYLVNSSKAVAYHENMAGDPVVNFQHALKLATQSLLHCAMQNFEAAEALPEGLDGGRMPSVIVDSDQFLAGSPAGNPVTLAPDAFASLSRELDIGGKYQALIDAVFHPADDSDNTATHAVSQTFSNAEQSALRLHLHSAYLSKTLDKTLYEALLTLASDAPAYYQDSPIRCAFLEIFDVTLTGALVIGVVPSPEMLLTYDPLWLPYKDVFVTYLPGAPTPVKTHTSVYEMQAHLREQLWAFHVPHLLKLIPERDKQECINKVRDCLQPAIWNSSSQAFDRTRDPDAWIPVTLQPFNQSFLNQLVNQKQQRLKDDALFHAVSTALEDQKTADMRRAYFTQLAFNTLALGSFFVPGLGPVMLGLTAIQLSYEAFEGIDLWAKGDRQQALDYLVDVVENVALMAALGAANSGAGKPAVERIPVEVPSFIEELKPVRLPNGEDRLWQPDLQPFAHDTMLPADLEPDEFGLYHHQGKTWLALEDKTYSVKRSPVSGEYRLEPASKALSYEPMLQHNGAGAWVHELDRPREWQGVRLFRRLGHLNMQFSEETATQILHVSGIDEGVLRRVLSESQRLPAQLEDTMWRFKLDREVTQAFTETEHGQASREFDKRYHNLPASQTPEAALIQRVHPQLPFSITDELVRNASPAELQLLAKGKIPKRLGEEIRLYRQQVRLTRAYEGLYLDSAPNPDSDRLILHSLKQLPGWLAETAIELREGKHTPGRIDGIGADDASTRKIITRFPTGYVASSLYSSSFPEVVHTTLYSALLAALSDAQRMALASSGVPDALTLRQAIQRAPLPRWALRNVLGMQRPAFRSPMRLADGRLGYPLSGGGNLGDEVNRSISLRLINDLGLPQRLTVSAELIVTRLEQFGMSFAQIHDRLGQLTAERQELQESLEQWRADPGVITDLASRESSRQEINAAIWQQWFDNALPELNQGARPLRLQNMFIAEFPQHLPDFIASRTRHLQLSNLSLDHSADGSLGWPQFEAQLRSVFQHFPLLERLEIERPYNANANASELSSSLQLVIRSFPQLTELSFVNQNHVLTPQEIERLGTREHLNRLDLSGNVLDLGSASLLPDWHLDYLGLERMRFERWPTWLSSAALERIGEVSVRTNNITVVPEFLLNNETSVDHHTLVSLDGNAIFPSQLREMYLSQDGQQRRFSFNLALPIALEEQLSALMNERQQLRDEVYQWANASSSSAPTNSATTLARTQLGQVVLNYWESRVRGATLFPLHLEDITLDNFPSRLPAFFYRYVEHLRLRRVETSTEQLNQFLRRFPWLRSLTVEGHTQPLRALPSALLESNTINELYLREQGLVIDQTVMSDLGQMRNLTVLDLSGNSFSAALLGPIEFSRPLHRLYLRNTGLQGWPTWLDDIMPLYVLDLDGNVLTELPEHILSNPENDDGFTSISLADNPLSDETMRRAHLSQGRHRSYTFDIDLPLEILNLQPLDYHSSNASSTPGSSPDSAGSADSNASFHRHSPVPWVPGDIPNVELWLQGSEQMRAIHRSRWQALEQSAEAADLLNLIGRLSQSAPYRTRISRSEFIDRVWRVLDMAADTLDQRQLFNGMAQDGASSRTCHDGALLVFKQIEEQFLISQVGMNTHGPNDAAFMYQLTRRLYRQRELDNIAREQANGRDEAELRLAYHRRLATVLDLPAPADHMLYESAVRLRRGELESVERRVREAERGESFLHFATHFALWENYLRAAHVGRFEEITNAYHEGEHRLFERYPDESVEALEPYIQALRDNMENQERDLLRELTNRAGSREN